MRRTLSTTPLLMVFLLATSANAQEVISLGPGEVSLNEAFNGVTVNLDGGSIVSTAPFGAGGSLTDGVLNINSGSVSTGFQNTNSVVNLSGGSVGGLFANFNTEVNISGGSVTNFGLFEGSVANITGGQVLDFPDIFPGGTANISGGDVASVRLVSAGATANFFGTEFALDGVPIDLAVGETTTIAPATGQNLSAILSDGSPFEFDLNPFGPFGGLNPDQASPGSIITVTLTAALEEEEVSPIGALSAGDFTLFRDTLGQSVATPFAGADFDGDQEITAADFEVFAANFGEAATTALSQASSLRASSLRVSPVPEPGAAALALVAAAVFGGRRRR